MAESDYATVSSNTSIEAVRNLLAQTRIAIVTDHDQVVGVITKIDMIDYLTRIRGRSGSIVPPKA